MGKSVATILFEFKKAKCQAQRLEEIANEMIKLADNKYESSLYQLNNCWTGENSEEYQKKARILQEQMRNASMDLKNTATSLRQIATNIYHAEMRALELVKRRTYQ